MPDKQQREAQLVYILFPMVGAFVFLVVVCICGRKVKRIFHIPKIVATGGFTPHVRERLRADLIESDSDDDHSPDDIEGITFGGNIAARSNVQSRSLSSSRARSSSNDINRLEERTPLYDNNDWNNDLSSVYIDTEMAPRTRADNSDRISEDTSASASRGDIHSEVTGGSVCGGMEIIVTRESRVSESSTSEDDSDAISKHRSHDSAYCNADSNTSLSQTEFHLALPVYKLHCTCSCPCKMLPKYMERIRRNSAANIEGSVNGSVCDINSQGVLLKTVFMKRDCCERHLRSISRQNSYGESGSDSQDDNSNPGHAISVHVDIESDNAREDKQCVRCTSEESLTDIKKLPEHKPTDTLVLNPSTLLDLHETRLTQSNTSPSNNISSHKEMSIIVDDLQRDRHDSGFGGDCDRTLDSKTVSSERSRYGSGSSCDSAASNDSGVLVRHLSKDVSLESLLVTNSIDEASHVVTSV